MVEREHESFIEMVTSHEPEINVVDKDSMDKRIKEVFDQISNTLQRSYGPAGAHAIISQMPSYHITKDGWTIMKNLKYNSEYGYVDYVICGMISDICARLNYAVGDGTTSAVLASNHMYKAFIEENVLDKFFLPRNLISSLKSTVNEISTRLMEKAVNISNLPKDEMCEYIRKVVYVSSNADEEMTNTIVDIYNEIEYPAISVTKAVDGVTKGKIIKGFLFPAKLMDRLYVNNDNNTQEGKKYDIVIFDHKVGKNAYQYILKTLNIMCKQRMRKIICLAPMYDEVVLQGDIMNDLNKEYRQTHDINLIIMGFKCTTNYEWKRLADLAMLCNTPIITKQMEAELVTAIDSNLKIVPDYDQIRCINLDSRGIPGIMVAETKEGMMRTQNPQRYVEVYPEYKETKYEDGELVLRVGYIGSANLSMQANSVFSDFIYDESLYRKYLSDAKKDLDDVVEKYKKLGTFSFEVDYCKKRLLGLEMKMAQIEVGASSEFSQNFAKDAMDDAVKAAESAYKNGVIVGGHVTLLSVINDIYKEKKESDVIVGTLLKAFKYVHMCLLENAFGPYETAGCVKVLDLRELNTAMKNITKALGKNIKLFFEGIEREEYSLFYEHIRQIKNDKGELNVYDFIIEIETWFGVMLNFNTVTSTSNELTFDKGVINSAATDREILLAASDLIGLLITGNQLVVSNGNH